jgi:light-regulated signal transduction histidine kinase (bacteriophytochrome)
MNDFDSDIDFVTNQSIDLTNCDREPIHIPGLIQPHGFLIEFTPNWEITRFSENCRQLFGSDIEFGNDFRNLLGSESDKQKVVEFLSEIDKDDSRFGHGGISLSWKSDFSSLVGVQADPLQKKNHRQYISNFFSSESGWVSETEIPEFASFQSTKAKISSIDSDFIVEALYKLRSKKNTSDLFQFMVDLIQKCTGFDRVMLYRFDSKWNGEVISEVKKENLLPYLGLHYPASDIPVQARRLYEKNLIRFIPNIFYEPVKILGEENLDLSGSRLRSVSPIHIEYLGNMGVTGTLTISLLVEEKLWGLIACHHYSPHWVDLDVRSVCLVFSQIFSVQIESLERQEKDHKVIQSRNILSDILTQMLDETDFLNGLIGGQRSILDLVPCDGAGIYWQGEWFLLGTTPSKKVLNYLLSLQSDISTPIFSHTLIFDWSERKISALDSLQVEDFSGIAGYAKATISKKNEFHLYWFREEIPLQIRWSGDPHKPVTIHGKAIERLHPRKSFEVWEETVRGKAQEWSDLDIQMIRELQNSINSMIIRKSEEINRLFDELQIVRLNEEQALNSLKEKEILIREIHHRVKNNMQIITGILHLQSVRSEEEQTKLALTVSQNRIRSMALVHELLYSSENMSKIEFALYIEKLLDQIQAYSSESKKLIQIEYSNIPEGFEVSLDFAIPCGLIFTELVTNSVKHSGSLETEPRIEIKISLEKKFILISVKDSGPGFPGDFDLRKSTGLGLQLVQSLVKQLEGSLELSSNPGAEIRIKFPLPKSSQTREESNGKTE